MVKKFTRKKSLSVFLFICLIFSIAFATNKAQAGTYDREEISLNGVWDFYPNGGTTRYDINVPSYWDGSGYFGYPSEWASLKYGIYRRYFTIPSAMAGKQIFLSLDKIATIAKVYVNGTEMATETGNYLMTRLPYKLDITSVAMVGQINTLEVRVWAYGAMPADTKDADGKSIYPLAVDYTDWGRGRGICADVALVAYPKVYVSDTYIVTDLKKNTDPADDVITVNVTITNKTTSSQTVTVKNSATLVGGSLEKSFADRNVTVAANSSQTVTISNVSWTNAKYWWPHDPKLYDLKTTVAQGTTTIDSYTTRFGFRQFNKNGNYFQLNGIKTNLRGDSIHFSYYIECTHGSTLSPKVSFKDTSIEEVKKALDEWKVLYNMGRTHTGGAIKEFYDYADKIGLMIIDETPFWQYQNLNSFNTQAMDNITKWVRQWVNANKNHPSIVIWSGGNENGGTDCTNTLIPTITNAISAVDNSRPIIQDCQTTDDMKNQHYTGGYPYTIINNSNLYSLYTNDADRPKGEGEAITPSKGWPTLNADGTYNGEPSKDYTNDNLVSQAVWHRAANRIVRGMRYAGLADSRYYADWKYAYEVIEDTLYPTWSDMTAPGIKPTIINRPIFNVFSSSYPEFIKSDSYEYTKNTFSPVAAFDKIGDQENMIGVTPTIFTAGDATRTIIVYNDEQRDGTSINVSWEAGYLNPVDDSYISFQTGSFDLDVPYGCKAEHDISFTVPSGVSSRWLLLKLTARKGSIIKFEETNKLGAIGSIPAPKIYITPTIDIGVKNQNNKGQQHKIKIINKGGGLSTNWSVTGQGQWLTLSQTSGNLRGEREIFFTVDPSGLLPNTNYSKILTFSEAGGSSAQVTIKFRTDDNPGIDPLTFEGENQSWTSSDGVQNMYFDGANGGQYCKIRSDGAMGDYGQFYHNVDPGIYTVKIGIIKSNMGGKFKLMLDTMYQGEEVDTYAGTASVEEVDLGIKSISSSGSKLFKFEITGKNSAATDYAVGIDYVKLVPVPGITLEGEGQTWTSSDGTLNMSLAGASGGQYCRIYSNGTADDYGQFYHNVDAGAYEVKVGIIKSSMGGKFKLMFGTMYQGDEVDTYADIASAQEVDLGTKYIGSSGSKLFKFEITGKNSAATDYDVRIDYVKLVPVPRIFVNLEGEDQTWTSSDGISKMNFAGASGGQYCRIESDGTAGDYGQFYHNVDAGVYTVKVGIIKSSMGGKFKLMFGSMYQGDEVDTYADTASAQEVDLGIKYIGSSGSKLFKFEITGKNSAATDYDVRIDYVKLIPYPQ